MTGSVLAKTERNSAIVAWRKTGMTYREIGERYGISTNRARQIVIKAEVRARRANRKPSPGSRRVSIAGSPDAT